MIIIAYKNKFFLCREISLGFHGSVRAHYIEFLLRTKKEDKIEMNDYAIILSNIEYIH